MVFPVPYGETVTLLRSGPSPGRDEYGKPIAGPVTPIDIPGCVVTPRMQVPEPGGSDQQARDTTVHGLTVYFPPGILVLTTDRARVRGVDYEVTGEAGDWGRSPFTGTPGPVVVNLDRIAG